LDDAFSKVKDGAKGLGEQISEGFNPATAAAVALGTSIANLGAEIATHIADAVKEAIFAYSEWGGEIDHLQKRIGGSSQELAILKVALDSVGVSQSEYEAVARRLPVLLEQHADKFKAAGVAYADANGNLLPTQQIIQNVTSYLDSFSAGAARNTAGVALMGRAYSQYADMVELTASRMQEADAVAKRFGMTLSQDDLEAANEFDAQLSLMHSAINGFYVTIGQALTPALTALATALRDMLAPVFDALRPVVAALGIAFDGIVMVVVLVADGIAALGNALIFLVRMAGAGALILKGDVTEGLKMADAAAKAYTKSIDELGDHVSRTARSLSGHIEQALYGKPPEEGGGGGGPAPKPKVDPAELAAMRAQAEAELALQREYSREWLALLKNQYDHGLIDTDTYYNKKLAAELSGIDASIKTKQKELDDSRAIAAADQTIAAKLLPDQIRMEGQINVLKAQRLEIIRVNARAEQDAENQRMAAMMRLQAQEQLNIAQSGIERERADAQQRLALRQITAAQLFSLQEQEEARSLAATKEFLRQKLEADLLVSKDRAKTMQEFAVATEQAELKHQQKMTDIDNAATRERMKYQLQAQQAVQDSMATMFEDLMKGTKSLSDAFKSFADSVIAQILRIKAQQLAASLMGVGTGGGGGGSTVGSDIGTIIGGLAHFAVGTNYVPNDMLAVVHRGERIVPASQNNPNALGGTQQHVTVNNSFTVAGSVDTRTQAQLATLAGQSIQRAMSRNA